MKKFLFTAAAALMMLQTAFADDITVNINGSPVEFDNTLPVIVNNRTLVPLRGVFDAMGYEISWEPETKTALLVSGYTVIEATTAGLYKLNEKGSEDITGDVPPVIMGGSFMIPVRAISEASGADVQWNAETKTVDITADTANVPSGREDVPENTEQENIEGRMSVDEKEYIASVKKHTDEIKAFVIKTSDRALSHALGISISEENLNDKTDYAELENILADFSSVAAPDKMSQVQEIIDEFIKELRVIINSDDPVKTAEENSSKFTEFSENFGIRLYNYFIENKVNWEKVYGDTVLDALKTN